MFVRCPYLLTDYFGHIVTSIAETLALHDQSMLLDAGDAVVRSTAVRELPRRRDVYGAVLILPPEPRADLEALVARGYPLWWWTRVPPCRAAWCRSRRRTSPAPGPSPGT